jgi:histidyl-tRNA synthetase
LSGEEEAAVLDRIFSGNLDVPGDLKGRNSKMEKQLQLLFGLKGTSPGFVGNLRSVFSSPLPALESSLDELSRIAELLTGIGCSYQIDFTSGRGFEYYTGVIFGFYSSGRRLGGGGRYDELIPLVGGKDICASGFALYIDELMDLVKEVAQRERVLVRAKDDEGLKESLEVARALRDAGYIAEFDLGCEVTADFHWIVDMRSGEGMELIDRAGGKKQRAFSPAELLGLLEEAG